MADPNADLMTGSGYGTTTLDEPATGSADADVLDAAAAVEAAEAGNASEEDLAELRKRLRTAEDRAAGHKGEATQAKDRARRLEQENEALRQQMLTNQQRLDRLEQQLTRREAEVAEVDSRARQQTYLRERIAYWQNEGYADDIARQYAATDLQMATQYERLQAEQNRIEQEKITIAQQKQEAQLEAVIATEVREAIASAKADGLTIRLSITEAKDAILEQFRGKRFNERDVARTVARLARAAERDAETAGKKGQAAERRAGNRAAALANGPDFEDGGTAGLSFDELEQRYAEGDTRLFGQYQEALKKRGLA